MVARNSPAPRKFYRLKFELGQFRKVPCPGVYLGLFELEQALQAEAFDGEAAEDRAINHGAAERSIGRAAGSGQIAHKAASETVAGAGGIVRLLERESGHA